MTIQVKHSKVSTIPDTDDTSLVRPSDWNADHTLVGTIDVPNGGTGASTLTGYVKGNGTSAMTASATVPSTDITGLGTMSTQNANAVAITGGTINGTTIGATSATTVNATTLSGQTGVLKGTGQNLVVQSQAFATTWAGSGLTRTNNASTAPDSTSTASSLIETATTAVHWAFTSSALNLFAGTYTLSCYIKANGRTAATLAISGNTSNQYSAVTFDLSGVAVTQTNVAGTGFSVASSSITSVGSGWYRCVVTTAIPARSDYLFMLSTSDSTTFSPNSIGGANSYAGNASLGIFAWGAQLEAYSTVGTYIPTTTTTLLGSPTLSFGNLAYIGMENNGAVYVQPALTGAIQAQATTSTTAGGNARGANAVDWQTSRATAAQVASAIASTVSGGANNTNTGTYSFVGGGFQNTSSANGAGVVSGSTNVASGQYSFIGAGVSNVGTGFFNVIGGGFTNAGTANAAVTTQATTAVTSGSTAVTLSATNASIKVGQYITGTGIAADTYVSAISTTSLTLSKNATATGTPTLSFFTPHGVVVGGGNNQATGSYSFIGGGGDAGTAANRNTASGAWSTVVGGWGNVASGGGAFIGGGGLNSSAVPTTGNTASGNSTVICGGMGNTATASYAIALGGFTNVSNGLHSVVLGGSSATARGISGNVVFSGSSNPFSFSSGAHQAALLVLGAQTTDATATALCSTSAAAGTTNQVILPNNSAYFFRGEVVSGKTAAGDTKGWTIEGVIKRGANAASTTLVGTPTVTSTYADAGASTWDIAVTADTTNGGIRVTFTGQAATTIRTVCQIRTTEMTF